MIDFSVVEDPKLGMVVLYNRKVVIRLNTIEGSYTVASLYGLFGNDDTAIRSALNGPVGHRPKPGQSVHDWAADVLIELERQLNGT